MGGYIIKIIRKTGLEDKHVSENLDIDVPVVIENNGNVEDLYNKIFI